MPYRPLLTPIGELHVVGTDALERIDFERPAGERLDGGLLPTVVEQLTAYFAGELATFELDLDPSGTSFQREVWASLAAIPHGKTWSYTELARYVGRPNAIRAVGAANGRNPLPIVLPCHRVVGAHGELRGYAGGLSRKRWLLDHEGAHGGQIELL